MALLPLRLAHACGTCLGYGLALVPSRRRATTHTNLALCFPDKNAKQRAQLARANLVETAKGITETSALWLWPHSKLLRLVVAFDGYDSLQQAYDEGRGVILAAPHLGAWEIVGLHCSTHFPMTTLYRPPPLKGMDGLMRQARERLGAKLVATNAQGVRALYQALGRGEMIGILPDQDPARGSGVFAPFFGLQANTMVLLSRLAAKTRAVVMLSYAERLPAGRGYRLHFLRADDEIYNKDVSQSTAALNRLVEQGIRQLPEQYLWIYKRFRTRPEGEAKLYRR